jgi:hypothetical protein
MHSSHESKYKDKLSVEVPEMSKTI